MGNSSKKASTEDKYSKYGSIVIHTNDVLY
jgi:hypothetical protein